MGEPTHAPHGGCAGWLLPVGDQLAGHCRAEPVAAGLIFYRSPKPGEAWLAFACPDHRHLLVAPREITEADRLELERRIRKQADVIGQHTAYAPDQPLAVGDDARALIDKARAWAASHT
jgi:hypothetical protein